MNENLKLSIFEIVGSSFCVASNDGEKVYERLFPILKKGHGVSLSFRNVTVLTSAFLNAAIGQLYGELTEDQITSLLKVEDIESDDLSLIEMVADNAKLYFKDPTRFDQAMRDARGEENDDE